MDQRYNYFHQNPNPLVNGQSTFNQSSMDGTQSTNNYSGNISSMSSKDQSSFHERKHKSSNEVPLMNSHLYQMDSSNQPPRSSGPPRTNIKGIYETSQSSIPNVINLAQTNADNYPLNPDFQLQPHLTGLLPQQSKKVPEVYPVDNNNTGRGSIAANMNTNYFSANKSYPEPKIIEYEIEETSTTESSPQHTSSLYSESTDQDSESIHQSNLFTRHTLPKNTECHVTKELNTITSSNDDFPVPSQFADLSLSMNDDCVDEYQNSIINNTYNQDNEDIIKDIPLSDNVNQNKIDSSLENQENLEFQMNKQSFNMPRAQTFDYYANNKDFSQTEFNYENKQGSSPISNNKTNYLPYNINNTSNIQNSSLFNKGSYLNQSNTSTQPSSLNSSISQQQSKTLFSYNNTELLSHQQESPRIQNYYDGAQPIHFNQQDKNITPVLPIDSKLQSNVINSNILDKIISNQPVTHAQTIDNQNSYQHINSIAANVNSQQDVQTINQQLMRSSSNSSVSEILNDSLPITSHATNNSSLIPNQSISPPNIKSNVMASTTSSISEDVVQENQNILYQISEDQASQLSNAITKNDINSIFQHQKSTVKSELDNKSSQSPSNILVEHHNIIDQSKCNDNQTNECQHENVNSSMTPIRHYNQHDNFLNSMNATQIQSNYQQPTRNEFVSQQSASNNDNIQILNDQLPNNSLNVISHSINNQNETEQKFISTTGPNVSQYFNSTNAKNQSLFDQQSVNIQQTEQLQNIKPISSFLSQDKSNYFSNVKETSAQLVYSSQQHPSIHKELETINGNVKLNSNVLPKLKDELNSKFSDNLEESVNNCNIKPLEHPEIISDNIILNDQFSNITIENCQNISNNQSLNQEKNLSAPYFSNEMLVDKKNGIAFSSAVQAIDNLTPKLSGTENTTQTLINNQATLQSSNQDQLTVHQNLQLPINNQTLPAEKPIIQPVGNEFASQQFNKKLTSHFIPSVPMVSNQQFASQMLINQPESDTKLISNPYSTQTFNNQQTSSTTLPVSIASNQLQPQVFNNQPKIDTSKSQLQSTSSLYSTQTFNNQQTANTTLPVSSTYNTLPPQLFSNQPKSNGMLNLSNETNPLLKSFNNQSIQNSVPSTINQYSPNVLNGQATLENIPPFQHAKIAQPFNPQSTQNILPETSVANQLPTQLFGNSPKLGVMPPQPPSSQFQVKPLSDQPIPDSVPIISSTANQYTSQQFNNQARSTELPTVPLVNQLPSQILSNQIKSDIAPPQQLASKQYPPHQYNNQPRPNTNQQVSSTVNNLPPPMFSNQPRLDSSLSKKPAVGRYPKQPISNLPILSNPSIQQVSNQHPTYTQPKSNIFPHSQPITNQYPSQLLNNQPGQQVLSKPPPSNQFYNQINTAQPIQNQWTPHPSMNKLNQQPSNLTNLSSSVSQQTQRPDSQMLPPNSNNYYNQMQGNIQQSQPSVMLPGQQVQLGSKGYPQQNNTGFSNQINYQQSNQYRPEQNTVLQQGFSKTWGYDNLDLLKSRDILPGEGIQPPEIKLPQGYANCDNCSPDVFRCTLNKFPSSKNLLDKCRLPLGILIHPYKDLSRLTVIQCETITRCRNCRSYINPFVQFIDNAHWKCNLCYRVNELPGEFQIDPYTKTLGDPSRRPEIQNATIEYIASQDYMVRPPQPALYLFLLDVSRTASLSGYLEIVCDRILNKIMSDDIPGDSRTNIGFITYDSSVHFYQIANCDGGQPKQLIVSDISDIFLPLPEGLMVNLEENKLAIKDLLTSLPNHYRESYNTGCALGAALQAAFKILAPRGGRVTVFQACLPNCGPGSLQSRDDGNPHTGDRVQHMAPSTDFYKKLALECSAEQIAVDMFFVSPQYLDVATLSGISKYSAGCIHNFPQFDVKSPTVVTRFINCFDRYLCRKIGFEALLRLRCTRGVAIHSFHGNFFVRSSDLLMLPNVNPDNAYGMQLSIEDSLDGVSVVCFQAALLYTSSNAERRIRVHTLCIPVTDNINDVFHNADQQAITGLIAKMAVDTSTEKSLSDAREAFFNAISDSLSAFKLNCSSYNGPGTMLTPLSLKMFPLYILATLKHMAFRIHSATRLDERMFSMCQMKSLPLTSLIQYIYPDLYPIHALEEQPKFDYEKLTGVPLPPVIQLSAERVESNGIYLMDDSETLTIFIGSRCSDQLIQKLFGYISVNAMPELITVLTEVDSKPSYLLRSFISYLQHFKPYPLPIEIIKDNGPNKLRFYSRLVEDKFESSLSYYEYLQRLSQQVR